MNTKSANPIKSDCTGIISANSYGVRGCACCSYDRDWETGGIMRYLWLLLLCMPVYATNYGPQQTQEQQQEQSVNASQSTDVHHESAASSAVVIIPQCASGIAAQGKKLGISLAEASYYCHLLDQAAAYQAAFKLCPEGPEKKKAIRQMHEHLELAKQYLADIATISKWSDIAFKALKLCVSVAGIIYLGTLI